MTQENEALSDLARKLYQAKQIEKDAKERRIKVEEAIAAQVPIEGDRGSKTIDAGDGLKITVKQGVNYSVDIEAIRDMDFPADLLPLKHVPASWGFDATAYEKLRADRPEEAKKLAEHVTSKPAKVAVTLKI